MFVTISLGDRLADIANFQRPLWCVNLQLSHCNSKLLWQHFITTKFKCTKNTHKKTELDSNVSPLNVNYADMHSQWNICSNNKYCWDYLSACKHLSDKVSLSRQKNGMREQILKLLKFSLLTTEEGSLHSKTGDLNRMKSMQIGFSNHCWFC